MQTEKSQQKTKQLASLPSGDHQTDRETVLHYRGTVLKGYKNILPEEARLTLTPKSFLLPPDHPRYYTYQLEGTHPNPEIRFIYHFDGYQDVRDIDAKFESLPFTNERTIVWTAVVYAYFANQYSIDGRNIGMKFRYMWDPSKPRPASQYHAAAVFIKQFYPEVKPRLDWIENPPDLYYEYGKVSSASGWERSDTTFQTREVLRYLMVKP